MNQYNIPLPDREEQDLRLPAPRDDSAEEAPELRRPHLFQPGRSGNPSGRPKRSKEEKDALEAIRSLAPDAVEKLRALLNSGKTSAATKVKICELILDRTYGRTESAVKLTSVQQTVEQSRDYVLSLVERIREEDDD